MRLYGLYSTGFKKETRERYSEDSRRYFIRTELVEPLRAVWNRIQTAPTKNGFAEFGEVVAREAALDGAQAALLRTFLREAVDARIIETPLGLWYLFESRVNALVSQLQKIHAVTSACTMRQLVDALCNSIDPAPERDLVEAWARQTPLLRVWEDQVSILDETGISELTPAETDAREFLRQPATRVTTSPRLGAWMHSKGHPKPTTDRIIFRSSFIHVDKSGGHGNYTFSLVGSQVAQHRNAEADEYFLLRERLRRAGQEGTDRTIRSKQRKEQTLLQEWIFRIRRADTCAICHCQFDRVALRAAHKKPRFSCTPVERLDPHIVMPLCLLGCDFLYEDGYIVVQDGKIQVGRSDISAPIAEYLKRVVDRPLCPEWLSGPTSYFRLPGAERRKKRITATTPVEEAEESDA
jgi:hypothetical protein